MDLTVARQRVHEAPVATLATITGSGRPHLVPCCFVLLGDTAYSAVDAKPKSTLALRRIDNLAAHPACSLLVDHYEEDWAALWWVRLDGTGRVVNSPGESAEAIGALVDKYPQYAQVAIPGPVIALEIDSWRAWP
jgi:PPOX class probable F420-dependent enzyme